MTVHIFDVDYTILRKSSSQYYLLEGLSTGVFSLPQIIRLPWEFIKYRLGAVDPNFIQKAVTAIGSIEQSRLDSLADRAFEKRMKGNIFPGAARLIRDLRAAGDPVFLATSAFYTVVRPLEAFLGLRDSITSRLEFEDGVATGGILGQAAFGQGKKEMVASWLSERNIPPGDARFYSDSYSDIPVMEYCGSAVAVNPDRFLLRRAKKRGWEVLRFR